MHVAYVGLGSNLGPREKNISAALNALERTRGIVVEKVSSLYSTDPVGGPDDQPQFINAAARLRTALSPRRLLSVLQQVETSLGRRRDGVRWGPRTIDLDLLLYDDVILGDDDLTLPHPLMHERRFVMQPLAEIAATVRHPTLGLTAAEILAGLGQNLPED